MTILSFIAFCAVMKIFCFSIYDVIFQHPFLKLCVGVGVCGCGCLFLGVVVCVGVGVCVYVRESEREKDRERDISICFILQFFKILLVSDT